MAYNFFIKLESAIFRGAQRLDAIMVEPLLFNISLKLTYPDPTPHTPEVVPTEFSSYIRIYLLPIQRV